MNCVRHYSVRHLISHRLSACDGMSACRLECNGAGSGATVMVAFERPIASRVLRLFCADDDHESEIMQSVAAVICFDANVMKTICVEWRLNGNGVNRLPHAWKMA